MSGLPLPIRLAWVVASLDPPYTTPLDPPYFFVSPINRATSGSIASAQI
jgi:hypothetical protein